MGAVRAAELQGQAHPRAELEALKANAKAVHELGGQAIFAGDSAGLSTIDDERDLIWDNILTLHISLGFKESTSVFVLGGVGEQDVKKRVIY
jgi:hypothetical protein